MRTQFSKFVLAASLMLALAFTFSCSSDDGDSGSPPSNSRQAGVIHGASVIYGGETYETVVIGEQTWIARNLNYAVDGSKCYGDGDKVIIDGEERLLSNYEIQANCTKYGRLYRWTTAMALDVSCDTNSCASQIKAKHRGICPSDWHIPSYEDWRTLMQYCSTTACSDNSCLSFDAGKFLKAVSGWNGDGGSGNGEDTYGFAALPSGYGQAPPGGYQYSSGIDFFPTIPAILAAGNYGSWWVAAEYDARNAPYFFLANNHNGASLTDGRGTGKSPFLSVRCLKD